MEKSMVDEIKKIVQRLRDEQDTYGLKTGFAALDDLMYGLHDGQMILIGAGSGLGKRSFALNIMHYVATKEGIPVAYFSLEESSEQIYSRLLSIDSMVELDHIKSGEMDDEEILKINKSKMNLEQAPIHIIDDLEYFNVSNLERKCIELKREESIGLIILDYFQLLDADCDNNIQLTLNGKRQEKMTAVSGIIKEMAVKLDIPVVVLASLRYRSLSMREDHKPKMEDLRFLGNIESDADVVLFIHRDDYYDSDNSDDSDDSEKPGVAEIIVAKHRNGAVGTIELTWISKYSKYENIEGSPCI